MMIYSFNMVLIINKYHKNLLKNYAMLPCLAALQSSSQAAFYYPFKKYVEYIFSPGCLSMMSRSILRLRLAGQQTEKRKLYDSTYFVKE